MAVGETWCPFCHLIRLYFETVLGAASYKIGWFWNFCYVVSDLCKAHAVSVMNFEFVNCSDQLPLVKWVGLFYAIQLLHVQTRATRADVHTESNQLIVYGGPALWLGADFIQGAGPWPLHWRSAKWWSEMETKQKESTILCCFPAQTSPTRILSSKL